VRLLTAYLSKGVAEIVPAGQLQPMLGIFQKLLSSKVYPHTRKKRLLFSRRVATQLLLLLSLLNRMCTWHISSHIFSHHFNSLLFLFPGHRRRSLFVARQFGGQSGPSPQRLLAHRVRAPDAEAPEGPLAALQQVPRPVPVPHGRQAGPHHGDEGPFRGVLLLYESFSALFEQRTSRAQYTVLTNLIIFTLLSF